MKSTGILITIALMRSAGLLIARNMGLLITIAFLYILELRTVSAYRFKQASSFGRVTLTSHQKGVKGPSPQRPHTHAGTSLPPRYNISQQVCTASFKTELFHSVFS